MLSYQQPGLRILIVDDHELTRYSLNLLFASQKNIEVVGLAYDGQQAIELVKNNHPDVVILDLQMPNLNGLSAASEIKKLYPYTQIIAYSSIEDPQVEVMVKTAPVDYFCEKDTSPERLIELVNQLGQKALNYQFRV
jgi:two-component system, NarL family, vancomycin resistance associated response regulator VraR